MTSKIILCLVFLTISSSSFAQILKTSSFEKAANLTLKSGQYELSTKEITDNASTPFTIKNIRIEDKSMFIDYSLKGFDNDLEENLSYVFELQVENELGEKIYPFKSQINHKEQDYFKRKKVAVLEWKNFTEHKGIFPSENLRIKIDLHTVGTIPIVCSDGVPQFEFEKFEKRVFWIGTVVGAGSVGFGLQQFISSNQIYEDGYTSTLFTNGEQGLYSNYQQKHNNGIIFSSIGGGFLVATGIWAMIKLNKHKKRKSLYKKYCLDAKGNPKFGFQPTFIPPKSNEKEAVVGFNFSLTF